MKIGRFKVENDRNGLRILPVSWVICVPVRQNSGVFGRSADIIRFTVTSDELSVIKLFSSVFISSSLLPANIYLVGELRLES